MAERYIKPALSFEAQVEQLARRGMLFNDRAAAARTLTHISYYRLSAYWHPFKRPDDSFEAGARFETARRRGNPRWSGPAAARASCAVHRLHGRAIGLRHRYDRRRGPVVEHGTPGLGRDADQARLQVAPGSVP